MGVFMSTLSAGVVRALHYEGKSTILRSKAATIPNPTSAEVKSLMADMIATMKAERGTGIAAPQIGVSQRMIVYFVSHERAMREGCQEVPVTGLANPVITPTTDEMEEDWEGCLSVPGLRGLVPRYRSICYSGVNVETGEHVEEEVHGFYARLLQHEADHLDGVLYIDKMTQSKPFVPPN